MSILVGILSRTPDAPLSDAVCSSLQRAISRNPNEEISVFRDRNVALFKVDVGAYGEPALRSDDNGSVTMLAGDPLLDSVPDALPEGRSRDLDRLHDALDREQWDMFASTQGAFCAAHWEPQTGTLTLVTDRLGLRPLYYWIGPEYVVFASALRVLEAVAEVPKVMDLVAVTEIAELGYPVGGRTAYAGISGLKGGELLQFTQDRTRSLRYWRWDSIKPSLQPDQAQLEDIYSRFRRAVRRRLGEDATVLASLSGGLDSRCVVGALRSESVQVHTLNFYTILQSQEQVFAAEFAHLAGTMHRAKHVPIDDVRLRDERIANAWRSAPPDPDTVPQHPQLWWMGDGGSVGVGHVYVDRSVVAALRAGEVHKAIAEYRTRLVPRVLNGDLSGDLEKLIVEDIRTELDALHCDDPGRSFYMFLMLYEQRYTLFRHFENIDLHRLELHLPFFDGDFLASIISAPLDRCLDHGLYTDWLSLFPPEVTSVPWQAYPGHRPCPLPVPAGLAYQWDTKLPQSAVMARRRKLLDAADKVLGSDCFPHAILSRRILRLARWMCRAGLQRGQGTIEVAEVFNRYWIECGGNFVSEPAATLEG